MNWQDDPELRRAEMDRRIRSGLKRTAIIWAPFFIAAVGLFIYFAIIPFAQGKGLRLFPFFVFGGLSVLFGFQVISSMRDLSDQPRTITGRVARSWRARDSLVFRTHYLRMETRQILRGNADDHGHIRNGDYIEVTYYPRSSVIVDCTRIEVVIDPDPDPPTRREPVEVIEASNTPEWRESGEDLRGRLGL